MILEGKALLGNFTLTHWALSLDSFWLVDAPFYAIAVLVDGVHPQLLHLVPAIIAVGVVGIGAWIAQRGRTRWPGIVAAGTVVVLLGLPTHAFAQFFLIGPLHVATTLWCLVAFVALRRARFGLGWLIAVVFLAAGLLGDLQTVVLGVVPIALAGVLAALRARRWRAGAPAFTAAVSSLVLAEAVRRIAWAIGTYTIGAANPRAPFGQMFHNAFHVITWGAALEGVGSRPFGSPGVPPLLGAAHAIGLGSGLVGDRRRTGRDRPLGPWFGPRQSRAAIVRWRCRTRPQRGCLVRRRARLWLLRWLRHLRLVLLLVRGSFRPLPDGRGDLRLDPRRASSRDRSPNVSGVHGQGQFSPASPVSWSSATRRLS